MGITERREREREEVRRKILDAARDMFASEGYDKVTMRGIADTIEYSPTTIYNHFEDKDDLVQCLCREDFAKLLGALHGAKPASEPVARIRELGRAYAAFGLGYPNYYRFMFMTPGKTERPHDGDPGFQSFALVHAAVAEAVASGAFRQGDPLTMARVLWAGLHGVVSLLITLSQDQWPQEAAGPELVDAVIENGIRGFLQEER
jgi:AcrR family transcriptional regulator